MRLGSMEPLRTFFVFQSIKLLKKLKVVFKKQS